MVQENDLRLSLALASSEIVAAVLERQQALFSPEAPRPPVPSSRIERSMPATPPFSHHE